MADEERTTVKTYVPRYQKRVWREHAEELGMSQSEFVRTMVQAGRERFGADETGSSGADPGGDALEDRLRDALSADEHRGWDDLRAELAGDFEDRLEDALGRLQERNVIEHSGRHGGYALTEAADE